MPRALALLLVAIAGAAVAAHAGSAPAAAGQRLFHAVVRQQPAPAAPPRMRCLLPARYRATFRGAAAQSKLPVSLLAGVAMVESHLRPDAHSAAGARGLLQLMPATAALLAVDAGRSDENVAGGARYLRQMLDRFGSIDLALAAYNAGPTAVARAGGAPTGATLTYVANVKRAWQSMAGCT
jgi:peptidoglycan DL-endopeptidase CwlO